MPNGFNQSIIDQFRASNGRVGPPFEGARLILLTTTGARSGARHTTPLGYLADEGNSRIFVIASAGGSPRHPAWFHNILADPRVTVEDGAFTYEATAAVLDGAERDEIFARAVEADPAWADYETKSGRTLPVVALTQTAGGPPDLRGGDFLKVVHDAFRRELALIREEVAESGAGLGAQLRINCLNLCQGLHFHHTMEDTRMFPHLDGARPDLAPVLARLREEHRVIQELVDELQKVVASGGGDVLAEVERLTAELEAHLDYEEEHLVPVLNGG
ncbi:nitroreductase/quinone reductase family protein [Nonomuraea ceibae]|uniref:nitroreductase/quinone reductase family protein n=1 Tax=Nonomuraea ceibae TaxID=1935170 RepID=UPI001C5D1313|nr:nitroreductase/quinone reductase family protein [Nonomuraea ceibae]